MKQFYPSTGLEKLCGLFGRTRQAFYDQGWRSSDEQLEEAFIIDRVKTIRKRIQGIGAVQLHGMLKEEFQRHNIHIAATAFVIF